MISMTSVFCFFGVFLIVLGNRVENKGMVMLGAIALIAYVLLTVYKLSGDSTEEDDQ